MFQTIPSMPVLALVMPAVNMNASLRFLPTYSITNAPRSEQQRAAGAKRFDDSVNARTVLTLAGTR
jgi:hypothetical protein